MRKANCKTCSVIYKRLSEMQVGEYERRVAVYAMRDAEAIADAVIWAKDRIVLLGALILKPGFKY